MMTFTDRVAKSLGRHFVTLSCIQRVPMNAEEKILVFSGFVIDVAGEWFYVTAGHILKDIRTALDAGSTFDVWRLGDQTASNRFKNTAIPYAFDQSHWLILENTDLGLDYAAVYLGGLYRLSLEAGDISPLAKDTWGDHVVEHDHWALVGIPSETVSYDGKTNITARFVMAPLIETCAPPLAGEKAKNKFYAKLPDGSENFVRDIDGMSGGPIFGLKEIDGIWKYKVIGIQSAWYRETRVLAACPFSSFGEALEPIVIEALEIERQSGSS